MFAKFWFFVVCLAGLSAPFSLFSAPLDPGTAVNITLDGSVTAPVSVVATSAGFMATWTTAATDVMTSFSGDQGQTWGTAVLVGSDSSYNSTITGRGNKFLVSWVDTTVGFSTGGVVASVSTDEGQTWSAPVRVSPAPGGPGASANPPVTLAQTSAGFMAGWTANEGAGNFGWMSFSNDGISWSTAVKVVPDLFAIPYDELQLSGNESGFLATWLHYDSGSGVYQAYASFSSDSGATWSTPVLVASNLNSNNNFSTTAASSEGFMICWVEDSGIGYSSFSTNNGATWTPKSPIASGLPQSNLYVSGTDEGFVVTIRSLDTGKASFSSDLGTSWSLPVQVTPTGDIARMFLSNLSVSTFSTECVFAWLANGSNAKSSYSSISAATSGGVETNKGLFRQITPNQPGSGLFR